MASRLNSVTPVGVVVRGYVREGARLFKRTVTIKSHRKVVLRFSPKPSQQTVVVEDSITDQPQRLSLSNQEETERNSSSPPTASHESENTTNDTTSLTQREWRGDRYELDLALSVTLYPNEKENYSHYSNIEEPVDTDSTSQNERLNNSADRNDVSRAVRSIYKSLKSTKKRIDKFVKWYRGELERRNMI